MAEQLRRRPGLLALAVALLLLAATGGCLCRSVPSGGVQYSRALLSTPPAPPDTPAPRESISALPQF